MTRSGPHAMLGVSKSITVTVKLHDARLALMSRAVQVTVVEPTRNEPETCCVQFNERTATLSAARGAELFTMAVLRPETVGTVCQAGRKQQGAPSQ